MMIPDHHGNFNSPRLIHHQVATLFRRSFLSLGNRSRNGFYCGNMLFGDIFRRRDSLYFFSRRLGRFLGRFLRGLGLSFRLFSLSCHYNLCRNSLS